MEAPNIKVMRNIQNNLNPDISVVIDQ